MTFFFDGTVSVTFILYEIYNKRTCIYLFIFVLICTLVIQKLHWNLEFINLSLVIWIYNIREQSFIYFYLLHIFLLVSSSQFTPY